MPLLLVFAFIVVPLVELAVIIQVGQVLGALPTIVLLLAVSVAGAVLLRREGRGAWRAFRRALDEGRLPAAEVVDGVLVIAGGALLLTPGFVTDAVGLVLVVPPTRAAINRGVRSRVRGAFGLGPAAKRRTTARRTRRSGEDALEVEVVKVERTRDER